MRPPPTSFLPFTSSHLPATIDSITSDNALNSLNQITVRNHREAQVLQAENQSKCLPKPQQRRSPRARLPQRPSIRKKLARRLLPLVRRRSAPKRARKHTRPTFTKVCCNLSRVESFDYGVSTLECRISIILSSIFIRIPFSISI